MKNHKTVKKFKHHENLEASFEPHGVTNVCAAWKENFYRLSRWKSLRRRAFKIYGKKCHCCGKIEEHIHVDHIKPRSKFPELAFDITNLQILCSICKSKKGNHVYTDFRNKKHKMLAEQASKKYHEPLYLKRGKAKKYNKKFIKRKIQKIDGKNLFDFESNLKNTICGLRATIPHHIVDELLNECEQELNEKHEKFRLEHEKYVEKKLNSNYKKQQCNTNRKQIIVINKTTNERQRLKR